MKTTITSALAFLLFAGASTAALAQDHDHDRGQGGGRPDHQGGPPGGGAPRMQPGSQPGGQPHAGPRPAPPAAPAAQAQPPRGDHARFGAPPASGGTAPAERGDRGDRGSRGERPAGERFGRDAGPQGERFRDRGPGDARQYDRGGPPGDDRNGAGAAQGERRFDRSGAPREVVPPRTAGGERGWDRNRDSHAPAPGRGDGRGDGRWNGHGQPGWQHGDHWQRGRLPPVFWSQQRYHLRPYRAPYGYYVRDWGYGDILPRGWFGNDYWIDDFLDYDLPYPPPGYEWVRVGGDALLIDRYSGRIAQVVRGIFW